MLKDNIIDPHPKENALSLALIIWLITLSSTFTPALSDLFSEYAVAHTIYRAIFLIALLSSLLYIVKIRGEFFSAANKSSLLYALIVLGILSTIWSISSIITLKTSLIILAVTLTAYCTTHYFSAERFLKLLIGLLTIAIISSLIIWPGQFSWSYDGLLYKSFFSQKNHMGIISGLYILLIISCAINMKIKSARLMAIALLLCGAATWLLMKSGSAGSFIEATACLSLLALLLIAKQTRHPVRNFLLFMLTGLMVLYLTWEQILLLLERSPTLTGRTTIWKLAFEGAMDNIMLGVGLGSAWIAESPIYTSVATAMPMTKHAHNGYLEIYIETGTIGLLIFLGFLIQAAYNISTRTAQFNTQSATYPFLMIIAFFLLSNTIESLIFRMPFLFYLFLVSVFYLQKETLIHHNHSVNKL